MPFASFWETADVASSPISNTSAKRPHFEAHRSFIINTRLQKCGIIHNIPYDEQCEFVRESPSCHDTEQYVDYMTFLYCPLNVQGMLVLKLCLLVLICVYIFLVLGMTADEFFCPALAVISKLLGLSENLAGVTLLAFGNGAPDLFTAFANYEGDSELMYAELFGAAAFIIGTVAAVIVLMRPFTVVASDFRRDVMFFLVACVWIAVAFYNERFTYFEANGAILIYVLYFAVVLVQHFRAKRRIRRTTALLQYNLSDSLQQQLQTLERRHLFRIRGSVDEAKRTDEDASVASDESDNGSVVCGILRGIRPFGADEWREAGWCGRGLLLVRSPIRFGLRLMIPCVDYTLPRNGWNKGLNVLHVLLLPLGFMLLKQLHWIRYWGVPLYVLMLPALVALAMIVFCTSENVAPPRYHMVYAFLGSFVGSITVISAMATELVALIRTFGIVGNLSESFLGLSVVAWGNSVGDLVSNIALARKGYQRMAFAACFGGPLFNSLIGIGTVFNLRNYYSDDYRRGSYARDGAMGSNSSIFLFMLLFFMLLAFSLCQWQARRSIGILMLSVYALFVVYSTMGEFEVLHPYGTDHRDEEDT